MRLSLTFVSPGSSSIYRIRRLATFEHGGHVGGGGVAHHDARRARGAADVRREDHVRELREFGMELRLALEDVETRAGDALRLQRVYEGRVVDHAAARAVYEDRGGLHLRDLRG